MNDPIKDAVEAAWCTVQQKFQAELHERLRYLQRESFGDSYTYTLDIHLSGACDLPGPVRCDLPVARVVRERWR